MLSLYLSMLETEREKQAFSEIYERYKYDCLHVAMMISGDKALSEDAVHNAFMEIIDRKEEYLEFSCSKMKSRIVIITKNKMIDLLRKNKRLDFNPFDDDTDSFGAGDDDIALRYEEKETLEHIMDCVAKLPEIYKAVLELFYFHEMSYKEIAKELGISDKAVSVRIVRAKEKLRDIIEKDGAIHG